MIHIQYKPRSTTRKWRDASGAMHLQGLDNMQSTARALCRENGWHDWRIVDDSGAVIVGIVNGQSWGNTDIGAVETVNGLLITASNYGRADIAQALRDGGHFRAEGEVLDALGGNGLEIVPDGMLGLTQMPAFSCGLSWEGDDSDARAWDGEGQPIYGYPDYQVSCPWEALRDHGRGIFPKVAES